MHIWGLAMATAGARPSNQIWFNMVAKKLIYTGWCNNIRVYYLGKSCGTLGKFQPRKKCSWISKYTIYCLKPLNPVGKSCQPYEEPGVFSSVFNGRGSDTGWPPNLTFKTVPAMTHNLMRQMGPISGRLGGMSEPQRELTARKDALKRSRRTCSRGGEGF